MNINLSKTPAPICQTPFFVGFGHYSRVGKDTTANALVSALRSRGVRAVKRPFALPLKQACFEIYKVHGLQHPEFYDTPENEHLRDVKLPGVNLTPVEIWVGVGNKLRELYLDTWTDPVVELTGPEVICVPDVRFRNEVKRLRTKRNLLVKVVRPGFEPRNTISDTGLLNVDWYDEQIGDSGEKLELITWAESLAHRLSIERPWT